VEAEARSDTTKPTITALQRRSTLSPSSGTTSAVT
jgi:hypothetical protein